MYSFFARTMSKLLVVVATLYVVKCMLHKGLVVPVCVSVCGYVSVCRVCVCVRVGECASVCRVCVCVSVCVSVCECGTDEATYCI